MFSTPIKVYLIFDGESSISSTSTVKSYKQALFKLFIFDVLGRAGLVINLDKGQMPIQVSVYFGFVVDSRSMRIYLPEKKFEMISGKTFVFMKTSCVHVVGGVNAMNELKVLERQPSKTPVYYPCQLFVR